MEETPETSSNRLVMGLSVGIAVLSGIGAFLLFRRYRKGQERSPLIQEVISGADQELRHSGITLTQPLKDLYDLHRQQVEKDYQEAEKRVSASGARKATPKKSSRTPAAKAAAAPKTVAPKSADSTSEPVITAQPEEKTVRSDGTVGPFKFSLTGVKEAIASGHKPEHNSERRAFIDDCIAPGNFAKIRQIMSKFNPKELTSVGHDYASEAWSIVSEALSLERYASPLEHATLLMWAGTSSAILAGHLLRSKPIQGPASYDSLFDIFSPSMNFYYHAINVCSESKDDEQMLQVLPFCQFEVFGLWAMLASTFEKGDPQRMASMLQTASLTYGVQSIRGLCSVLSQPDTFPLDDETGYSYLQGWTLANMNILSRDLGTMGIAEAVSQWLNDLFDKRSTREAMVCSAIAQAYYAAAINAAEMVYKQSQKAPDRWSQQEMQQFHGAREQIAEDLMGRTVPGYAEHQLAQQRAAGMQPRPDQPAPPTPEEAEKNYLEIRGQIAEVLEQAKKQREMAAAGGF